MPLLQAGAELGKGPRAVAAGGSLAKPAQFWDGSQRQRCRSEPGVCFVSWFGFFLCVLKQQEAPGRELGRQGVRVANHAPPD